MAPTGRASTATTSAAEDAGGSADEANPDNPARGVEAAPPPSPSSDDSGSESASGSSMDLDKAGVAPLTDDDNLSDDSQLIFSVVRANHMRNVLAVAVSSKVNQFNRRGFTPLHVAAMAANPPIISVLLTRGADAHAATRAGDTALHLVAQSMSRNAAVAAYVLLQCGGANVGARNDADHTPADDARATVVRSTQRGEPQPPLRLLPPPPPPGASAAVWTTDVLDCLALALRRRQHNIKHGGAA